MNCLLAGLTGESGVEKSRNEAPANPGERSLTARLPRFSVPINERN